MSSSWESTSFGWKSNSLVEDSRNPLAYNLASALGAPGEILLPKFPNLDGRVGNRKRKSGAAELSHDYRNVIVSAVGVGLID